MRLALGRGVGRLAFALDRRHGRVALDNLRAAYPDAPEQWHRRTARRSFENLGRLLVEVLLGGREPRLLERRLEVEGVEHLHAAGAGPLGYFTLSAHFGNWEWIALLQGANGYPMWMVTRPLDNPLLERWLAGNRESTGNRVVHKRNALRELVKGLRAGKGIAFLIDQNFGEAGAIYVPFFGRLAATTPALGSLAVRLGVPILPVFAYPRDDGTYRVVYEEPIVPPSTGDPQTDAVAVTELATRRVEAAIRRAPHAWFWMHRRWRSHPPGTSSA